MRTTNLLIRTMIILFCTLILFPFGAEVFSVNSDWANGILGAVTLVLLYEWVLKIESSLNTRRNLLITILAGTIVLVLLKWLNSAVTWEDFLFVWSGLTIYLIFFVTLVPRFVPGSKTSDGSLSR